MPPRIPCHVCGRTFSRVEHRNRHLLTHTEAKPYRCPRCFRQFQRADALRRHTDRHCEKRTPPIEPDQENSRARVKLACDSCHDKKLKCNGGCPCHTCAQKNIPCTYERDHSRNLPLPSDGQIGDLPAGTAQHQSYLQPFGASPQQGSHLLSPNSLTTSWTGNEEMLPMASAPADTTPEDATSAIFFSLDPAFWAGVTLFPNFDDNAFFFNPIPAGTPESSSLIAATMDLFKARMDVGGEPFECDTRMTQWLETPLIPRPYDLSMLNLLINVCMRHVSPVFCSFRDFEVTAHTLPEQILAVAAVGALFCPQSPGSTLVSRLLFADCIRMVFGSIFSPTQAANRERAISLAQTCIAVELFGICSGHQRSRELSEAYHYAFVQTLREHQLLRPAEGMTDYERDFRRRLLADAFMLECYRTSLLQVQPALAPSDVPAAGTFLERQASLLTDGELRPARISYEDIAAISIASWYATGHWAEDTYEPANRHWSPDQIDRALSRLLASDTGDDDDCDHSALMLCHTNGMALHTPFERLIDAAYSATTLKSAPTSTTAEIIRNWRASDGFDAATRHAREIVVLGRRATSSPDRSRIWNETPHDALCVYLAAIVIWAGRDVRQNGSAAAGYLEQAIETLPRLRVRLASNLRQIVVMLASVK